MRSRLAIKWTDAELEAWAPRTELTPSQWSEANINLPSSADEPGPFRLRRVPYMVPILDAAVDPEVETIVVCKPAQIAYTTILQILVGYFSTEESTPIFIVLADEDTSNYVMQERVQRMFQDSPRLRRHYESGRFVADSITLQNGSYVESGWASSVSKVGTKSFRIILLDEIDKPGYSTRTKEASPISLALERKESFFRWKAFMGSTPTTDTGNVTRELSTCDVVYDWHVPCPYCGVYQPLRWGPTYAHGFKDGLYLADDGQMRPLGGVKWEGGRNATAEQIASAVYVCGSCEATWNTIEKNLAVEQGIIVARAGATGARRKIGFHINRLYSLLGRSGDIPKLVDAWIQAVKSSDPRTKQGFINSTLAEPWIQTVTRRTDSEVLRARADVEPQVVPDGAVALTCGIDPQRYGFWFTVRAWSRLYASWLIHYGKLADWDDVFRLLFKTAYPTADGNRKLRIWRTAIDTGGGKFGSEWDPSMTEAAYWWIRKFGSGRGCTVWGTKGASHPLASKIQVGKPLDKMPSGKPIPGGLQVVLLDTDRLKDQYHYRLQSAISGEGDQPAYLHKATGEDYARHILAEEKRLNDKGAQEWVQVKPDNHLFDADCLAMAAADPEWPGGGVHIHARLIEMEQARRPAAGGAPADRREENRGGGYDRPSWLDR